MRNWKINIKLTVELFLYIDSSELRNRFSYLEPSGSQELDSILKYHNEKHEQISSDMLIMTRNIKEQSEMAGRIIREDTKVILSIQITTVQLTLLRVNKSFSLYIILDPRKIF